ncbi:hypothetical protein SUGI_0115110 [Cryptomeria japonica]|nr:hypothetical protein SUGI_0115110 [Cryptomeria japonica]
MAVTHADLAIDRSCRSIGSKLGTWVMIICTLLGLLAFVFGLLAEITKTETVWITGEVGSGGYVRCMYVDSGRSALVSGVGSMLAMGVAMGIGQAYMWMALCTASATDTFRPLAAWTESDSNHYTIFRWQALASFVLSWISFAVAAVLLIIGIAVEAGHTERQNVVRYKCTVVREGVFAAAGVFGLFATCMGVAFYASAVQTERLQEEEDNVRREIMELTIHYTPTSPPSPSIQQHPTFSGDLQK